MIQQTIFSTFFFFLLSFSFFLLSQRCRCTTSANPSLDSAEGGTLTHLQLRSVSQKSWSLGSRSPTSVWPSSSLSDPEGHLIHISAAAVAAAAEVQSIHRPVRLLKRIWTIVSFLLWTTVLSIGLCVCIYLIVRATASAAITTTHPESVHTHLRRGKVPAGALFTLPEDVRARIASRIEWSKSKFEL